MAADTGCPTTPKVFTLWSFTDRFADSWVRNQLQVRQKRLLQHWGSKKVVTVVDNGVLYWTRKEAEPGRPWWHERKY